MSIAKVPEGMKEAVQRNRNKVMQGVEISFDYLFDKSESESQSDSEHELPKQCTIDQEVAEEPLIRAYRLLQELRRDARFAHLNPEDDDLNVDNPAHEMARSLARSLADLIGYEGLVPLLRSPQKTNLSNYVDQTGTA